MTILSKLTLSLVAIGTLGAAIPAQAAVSFNHPASSYAVGYGEGWQQYREPSWNDRRDDRDSRYDRGSDGWGRGYDRSDWRNDRQDDGRDWRNDRRREDSYQSAAWRGRDGRYYCRRPDGTTGLLIGGAAGALIGRGVAGPYGDRTLGAIIGAAGGALLGRAIDRDSARCR